MKACAGKFASHSRLLTSEGTASLARYLPKRTITPTFDSIALVLLSSDIKLPIRCCRSASNCIVAFNRVEWLVLTNNSNSLLCVIIWFTAWFPCAYCALPVADCNINASMKQAGIHFLKVSTYIFIVRHSKLNQSMLLEGLDFQHRSLDRQLVRYYFP